MQTYSAVPWGVAILLCLTFRNYMNDSLRTDVFVRFQPESIACACIYLAARTLEIPLPNRPHWFLLFGASEEEIQEICLKILLLYTRKKVDLTYLESEVEKKKHAIEEAKAQAKGLLADGTPIPDNASGFSPVPKIGSREPMVRSQLQEPYGKLCEGQMERPIKSPKESKGNKPSPLSVQAMKNAKRKMEGAKRAKSNSPVNGLPKGRESRSRSGSRDQSYSRSQSRSASPKRRKSESCSTSSGSKSQSRSRSRSDSPPRQANHGGSYKGSKMRNYKKSKDYKYAAQKPRKSRSRSSSRSRSRSRERSDNSGKYKKKSHYYRDQRRERSRSYERTGHRYEREHPGHSRHRR
ncbi:cyclin-L2 isoform X1 [Dromiciops gliroides]|uniref:cyclin-L2 isoform X1 n=1 Tax=Dromiciops gliroides TaxID=33562 RepID=UPI001CC48E67|nr:cyclin-L2 isoform X1 [Dromiciops gliroides]